MQKMALKGIKVIEMMGLAPGPFCGKILADFGASVTVIQKMETVPYDIMSNGKRKISINLRSAEGKNIARKLISTADVVLDTYKPGVMEKLGLGPEVLLERNEKLVYTRLSGYGQEGIYKDKGGHDINYVAMSGLLSLLGKNNEPPHPPLNLLADFAGGSFLGVIGILVALIERTKSGKGQIVDVSMTDGAAYLGSWVFKSMSSELPIWGNNPGQNILDGGAPFYGTFKTKDGKYMAVGALEPKFYTQFLEGLGLSEEDYSQFGDSEKNRTMFKEVFLSKTQNEWEKIFDTKDACVTPVLDLKSVAKHPLHMTRKSFAEAKEYAMPEAAPKLSRTPGVSTDRYLTSSICGEDTLQILREIGLNEKDIQNLRANGHVFYSFESKL